MRREGERPFGKLRVNSRSTFDIELPMWNGFAMAIFSWIPGQARNDNTGFRVKPGMTILDSGSSPE